MVQEVARDAHPDKLRQFLFVIVAKELVKNANTDVFKSFKAPGFIEQIANSHKFAVPTHLDRSQLVQILLKRNLFEVDLAGKE